MRAPQARAWGPPPEHPATTQVAAGAASRRAVPRSRPGHQAVSVRMDRGLETLPLVRRARGAVDEQEDGGAVRAGDLELESPPVGQRDDGRAQRAGPSTLNVGSPVPQRTITARAGSS